jgi:predicted membrane channel-forming protein YqfA (hemolysin III family)
LIAGFLQVGCALKKLFDNGVVKRGEVWITSKLWYVLGDLFYFFKFPENIYNIVEHFSCLDCKRKYDDL